MKARVIMLVLGLVWMSSMVFGGVKEADDLFDQGKYTEAEVEYRSVLPSLKGEDLSHAQFHIGCCFDLQKKYNEAISEYRKVATIPNAHPHLISYAQLHIGYCLESQKKYDEAIAEYKKVATISGADPQYVSGAQFYIGCCLEAQGKIKEAQEEYLRMCSKRDSVFLLKQAFSKIDPLIVGKDKYVEYLNKLIMIIPATPENADFLGLLKSELEKLK